mmetsp:Transcript_3776/g.7917  ORF Transcript_3776/g.7917 Transcript_3776/m.7917 type:complete len:203 (-) Transcript_3776:77-685(-)
MLSLCTRPALPSVEPRLTVGKQASVLAHVAAAETDVVVRVKHPLEVPLTFHGRPERDPVELEIRHPHHRPAQPFQTAVLEHRVSQRARPRPALPQRREMVGPVELHRHPVPSCAPPACLPPPLFRRRVLCPPAPGVQDNGHVDVLVVLIVVRHAHQPQGPTDSQVPPAGFFAARLLCGPAALQFRVEVGGDGGGGGGAVAGG